MRFITLNYRIFAELNMSAEFQIPQKQKKELYPLISCMLIFRICIVKEKVRDNTDEIFSDVEFFHVYWYLVETMCLIYM